MIRFTPVEALFCTGLVAALFFGSNGSAAKLLSPRFYHDTRSQASDFSLAYQVLGYHRDAPATKWQGNLVSTATAPVVRAERQVKRMSRKVWHRVSHPFGKRQRGEANEPSGT